MPLVGPSQTQKELCILHSCTSAVIQLTIIRHNSSLVISSITIIERDIHCNKNIAADWISYNYCCTNNFVE